MDTLKDALTRRRAVPPILTQAFIWVGLVVPTIVAVFLIVNAVLATRAISELRNEFLRMTPPAEITVCRTGPTPACAAEAARRMGIPTAWMPAPRGLRFRWLTAVAIPGQALDRHTASEELVSDDLNFELMTQPDRPFYDRNLVDTYDVKGTEVMVLRERNPDISSELVTLLWTHSGTTYTLEVDNFPTLGAAPSRQPTI